MSSPGSSLPRLGPTWNQGGKGFQPPPAVSAERRSRSGSSGSKDSDGPKRDINKFAALDDEDEDVDLAPTKPSNSRSEALRTHRNPPSGKSGGRSLADLVASVPAATLGRSHSSGPGSKEEGGGRFAHLRSDSEDKGTAAPPKKVIRFTREKLLSMRPVPDKNAENPPTHLKHLDGAVILAKEAQDPVCWDTFDPDEIWAQVPARERLPRSSSLGSKAEVRPKRGSADTGGGRWQRGVALPPPDESQKHRGRDRDADNPDELWDDPIAAKKAAADFSAFGAIPDDPKNDPFDMSDMAEATRRFELERHGSKGSDMGSEEDRASPQTHTIHVDSKRPLASTGTTIQSGSGDDVNVFEDFGAPDEGSEPEPISKGGDVDVSASSRLMKMIGVSNEDVAETNKEAAVTSSGWTEETKPEKTEAASATGVSLSMNPWGDSLLAPPAAAQQGGLGLAAKLEAVVAEQKAREAAERENRKAQEVQMLRQRQEEEARQRSLQAQQSNGGAAPQQQHSQVELVLIERISTILEKSWGRSDLSSILATLHAEDSRVIPLLGNVDALRALIARHPKRIEVVNDPQFGAEMANLLLSNSQWKQQQQAQARAQQEEMQRREQQLRMQEMQEAAARAQSQVPPPINPDAPWFYSDPQKNIQGPFRGEEMRQWLEAGYFKGDLPISQQPTGPFIPLSTLFPDLSAAFKFVDHAEEREAAAAAKHERMMAEQQSQAEARAQAEAKAREAEAEAQAAKAAASKSSDQDKSSSAQLKMMLGMGAGGSAPAPEDQPPEAAPKKNRPQDKKTPKAAGKAQQRTAPSPPPAASPPPAQKGSGPAWGGVSASPTARRKSMSEIQQEEARAAARLAMERQKNPRSNSSGWANVAAAGGGSSGWSGGVAKPTPAAVVTKVNAAPTAATTARVTTQAQAAQAQPSKRQSGPAKQQAQKSSSKQQPADDFGASMPPALQSWCKDQMRKLNGTEDLTLVSFCMTLSDPDEIRQYLTAYLGSTPQVNNFATEFIKRKDGKKQQDEWETPAVSKKSKKKKGSK